MQAQLFPKLSERKLVGELMDDPNLDVTEHLRALEGLQRINRVTRTTQKLWQAIKQASQQHKKPISVTDVACGGGDVLIEIGRRAAKCKIDVQLTGLDISKVAIKQTLINAKESGLCVQALEFDILSDKPLPKSDIVLSSLFLHHLENEDAIFALKKMKEATNNELLISDLLRTRFGHLVAWFGTRILSRSPIVHTDGPLSVESAFSLDEIRSLCNQAGLNNAMVRKFFPERLLVSWKLDVSDS